MDHEPQGRPLVDTKLRHLTDPDKLAKAGRALGGDMTRAAPESLALAADQMRAVRNHPARLGYAVTAFTSATSSAFVSRRRMQAAIDHSYRLPERVRFQVRVDYYFTRQEQERAFAVARMMTELYPDDIRGHSMLAMFHIFREDKAAAIESLEREICELTWVVATNHLFNLTNRGLGIGSDGLCDPGRDPSVKMTQSLSRTS
jgi:hypothetical protein